MCEALGLICSPSAKYEHRSGRHSLTLQQEGLLKLVERALTFLNMTLVNVNKRAGNTLSA